MPINQLPLEVLGCIYSHYADEETLHYPLETLLLVCRTWRNAALEHRTLWSTLNIYLGHSPTSSTWKKRLPLRLARAGPTAPLTFSLFNVLDMGCIDKLPPSIKQHGLYCDFLCINSYPVDLGLCDQLNPCLCYEEAIECAEFALDCLVGNSGDLCARWKNVHVDLGYRHDVSRKLAIALCYPTPSLTSLKIANIPFAKKEGQGQSPLIQIPRLRELIVQDCCLPNVPNLQGLRKVDLNAGELQDLGGFSDLRSASQLEALSLQYVQPGGVILPEQLSSLKSIELVGDLFPCGLKTCEVPNVSTISLKFDHHNLLVDILNCPGIGLKKLNALTLVWAYGDLNPVVEPAETCDVMVRSVRALLTRAPNLEYVAGNPGFINVFLIALHDAWSELGTKGILRSRRFILHLIMNDPERDINGGNRVEISGRGGLEALTKLASDWRLVSPELPIETFQNLFLEPQIPDEDEGKGNVAALPTSYSGAFIVAESIQTK